MATRLKIVKQASPYETFEERVNMYLSAIEKRGDILSVTIHFEEQLVSSKMQEKPAAYIIYRTRKEKKDDTSQP